MGTKAEVKSLGINKLLRPYMAGGTKKTPIRRSLDTLAAKLIISNKMPPDIVGAVLFRTLYDMAYKGLEFKGDGSYGSKGTQLFNYIKNDCVKLSKEHSAKQVIGNIINMTGCVIADCPMRTRKLVKRTKWERFWSFMIRPRGLWRL